MRFRRGSVFRPRRRFGLGDRRGDVRNSISAAKTFEFEIRTKGDHPKRDSVLRVILPGPMFEFLDP
ncbi:MAG: hypothetical protein CMJ51_05260 [Planctomycetaceae bacterium]|nr:hypothetical protein [Planctomycetaceae bacterium]